MKLVHFHFPRFTEHRPMAPRPARPSAEPANDALPSFAGKIPLIVPLAAVVLAALVYFICWAVLA
jgi:hypothetical protein